MILLHPNIDAFLAVVKHSTVSMAAEKMGLTQTGVTQRIKSLESDFGTSFFTRSRKGMKLTAEGHQLFRHCIEIKATEGQLLSNFKEGTSEERIEYRISGPAAILGGRVVTQCHTLYKKWPNMDLHFVFETNANRLELLKSGKVDLAILIDRHVRKEHASKPLAPWSFCLVVPYEWRRRKIEKVITEERLLRYHEGDRIGLDYLEQFGLDHLLKSAPLYVNDNQAMLELIRHQIGFGVLTPEAAAPYIQRKEVAILNRANTRDIPIALTWYPRKESPHYFQDIIDAIN